MEPGQSSYQGITSWAIARPVGTIALSSVVVVLGLFFLERLAVDLLPTINQPRITVTVNYPGTAPEVMEQQVTRVLESSLANTENLISIESRASEGRTNVNLIFEYGTNIDLSLQDAARNLELARTQLPADIEPPRIYKHDPSQMPVFEAGFTSTTRSPIEVRDWMENTLMPQIQGVRGVGGVEVAGGQIREIQVIVDQDRLYHLGLPYTKIEDLLRGENVDIAAGQVTSPTFDVMAKTDGRFRSVDDIRNLLLPIPDDNIRLNEVAEVLDTRQEQRIFVRLNGQSATRLSITKLPEANTISVINGVSSELRRLDESGFIPDDIDYSVTTDQSFFINSSIGAVSTAAILGGLLAMLVVLLFLGSFRKAFIIGLTIPISLLATFAMMGLGGLTLNIMSLGGLALGVGLLLDNGIVMLENIFRHNEELEKESEIAALEGSKEVTSAILSATMTNLAAVLPFLFIPGLAAMIFGDLILTISFAILASLVAALTLVPMLAALLSKVRFSSGFEHSFLIEGVNKTVKGLRGIYLLVARRLFRVPWVVLGLSAVAFFFAFQHLGEMETEFFPQVDDGNVGVSLSLPPGAPPEVTYRYALMMEQEIEKMPHVDTIFGLVGGHLGGGILNERPGTARYSIQLIPASQREMTAGEWVRQMQKRLDELQIPGARLSARPPSIPGIALSSSGAAIEIGLVGDDIEILDRVGRQLLVDLADVPGLADLDMSRSDRSPLLSIDVDRDKAATLGLSVQDIGETARRAVQGVVPTRYGTGVTEYDIRVLFPREAVEDADGLANLILFRVDEEPIRLGEVADFRLRDGPAHIERENQIRVLRLTGEVNTAVSDIATVNQEIRDRVSELDIPDGYSLIFGGEEEVIEETNRALTTIIFLALFLVFVALAVQYEKFSNPLVILFTAPMALIGVIALLWLTDIRLSAPVMLGAILLVGIVVNNAILLVEYIEIQRQKGEMDLFEAALEAGKIRFRPILMTTTTTVCGMIPLAIGMGEGAEIMRPLAIAVIGGLLFSTLVTLLVLPCVYLILTTRMEQLKHFVSAPPRRE